MLIKADQNIIALWKNLFSAKYYKKISIILLPKINRSPNERLGQGLKLLSPHYGRFLQPLWSNISLVLLMPKESLQDFFILAVNSLAVNPNKAFLAPKQPWRLPPGGLNFSLNKTILIPKTWCCCYLSSTKVTNFS